MRPNEAAAAAKGAVGADDGAVRRRGAECVILGEFEPAFAEQVLERAAEVAVIVRGDTDAARQRLGLERRVSLAADGGEDLVFEC